MTIPWHVFIVSYSRRSMQMTTVKILTKHRYKKLFVLRGVSAAEQEEILDLVENRQILFFFFVFFFFFN